MPQPSSFPPPQDNHQLDFLNSVAIDNFCLFFELYINEAMQYILFFSMLYVDPSTLQQIATLFYVTWNLIVELLCLESVLRRWMKLEPIIQSEVSQEDKDQYSILTHIYGIQKDGNDNPICKTEKETQMYRTDFWTLWEKVRVGCFERTDRNMYIIQGETDHQPRLDA